MSGSPDSGLEDSQRRGGDEFSGFAAGGAWSIQASTVQCARLPVADAGDAPAVPARFGRVRPTLASAGGRERSS